jgi:glycosyltransferase involved in cell wall biosynthesis
VVVHFHGPWAEESAAAGERSAARLAAKRLVERFVYRRAGRLVVLSGAFRRLLVERYGVSPWKVDVIAPGVDLDAFRPGDRDAARARLGIPAEAFVAVAVRRLVPRMGLDVLLDAWALLASAPDPGLLLVVGDGPEARALRQRSEELGVGRLVRFLGRIDEPTLLACYHAADLCVLPSLALEGFGLVVLEGLATGTPVIATDVGGLPEALGGLDRGLVVPPGDAGALAARIAAARDGDAPLPSPARCREHAERFTWSRAVGRHREVYAAAGRRRPRRRLRVVCLDHCARPSGAQLSLLRLLEELRDVDAHVILAEDGPLAGRLQLAGVSVEVLPMAEAARGVPIARVRPGRLPLASIAGASRYASALALRLRRLRPDLVHTNSLKAMLYGGAAARLIGIPVVWQVHDRIAEDYLPPPAVRLVRAAARVLPTVVVANSRATLDTLGATGRPGLVIAPAIARDAVTAGARGAGRGDGGPLRVGMLGRIAPWKGQHVFLEAFARAFPDGGAEAVLVGAALFGEEDYEAGLRRSAADLGLGGRVAFLGQREDVGAQLARLDVLVHASVLPEPFGQVVVEGMAAGLPVVAAAAGGPLEIIEDGVDGLHVPPDSPDALAAVLRRLAADPALRRRLGDAARRSARRYAPERTAEQMRGAYRTALAVSRARRSPAPGASPSGAARPAPAAASTPRAAPRPSRRPAGR